MQTLTRQVAQAGALMTMLLVAACSGGRDQLTLAQTDFSSLPGWEEDNHAAALKSFTSSCDKFERLPADAKIGDGELAGYASDWQELCAIARRSESSYARNFFEGHFTPFIASANAGTQGLITGYFVPEIEASRSRGGAYQTPIYRLPPDLIKDKPYLDRKAIEDGALQGRGLEIAWAKDPVAFFFLQVQGSGILRFENGDRQMIGFAAKNAQPYVSLGREMIRQGLMERDEANLFTLKAWLHSHPGEARGLMQLNPSYVFFRELQGEAPLGSQGVPLTPERSAAIDPSYLPYGMPLYLMTDAPQTHLTEAGSYQHLLIAQDSGGAIRGPVRADIFFGAGSRAEALAGMMKQQGSYALFIPNSLLARR